MRYLNLGCGNYFHPDWVNVDSQAAQANVIVHDIRTTLPFSNEAFDAVYHSHVLEHLPRSEAKSFLQECLRVLRPGGVLRVVVPDLEQIAREYLQTLEEAQNGSEKAAHDYDWILLEMYDQAVRHHSGGDIAKYLAANNIPNEDYVIKRFGYEGETLIKNLRGRHLDDLQEITALENTDEIALAVGRFRLGGEVHRWMYDRYSLNRLLKASGFKDIRVCDATESQILNFSDYNLDVLKNGQVRKPDSLFMEASKPNIIVDSWTFEQEESQDKLKIVQISTSDIRGGAARAAYRLHQGLRLVNQDSLVLVKERSSDDQFVCSVVDLGPTKIFSSDYSLYAEIQSNYINNNRTELSNTLFSYPYPAADLTKVEQLNQADIINLHWVAWFQSAETIASLLTLGKPVVWTLHDMAAFTGGCHYSAGCQKYQTSCSQCPQLKEDRYDLASTILKDKVSKLSNFLNLTIVTPSQWLASCARSSQLFKNNRIEVIPYGIDVNSFRPSPKIVAKSQLDIPEDTLTLLFGADYSVEKRKGVEFLVQALIKCFQNPLVQELLQEGRIKILNFGHGCPSLDSLSSLGIPIVSLGYVTSDEELSYIYSAANVLLLPSLEDNLPNLLLEAMSCGTPVIAFSVGGMVDLIDDGQTGRLVGLEDVDSFSKAILDALLNPSKYEEMGLQARLKIEESYSLTHQANQYLKLYKDLIDSHQSCKEAVSVEKTDSIKLPNLREIAIEAGRLALLNERQSSHELNEKVVQVQLELQQAQAELQRTQAQLQETQTELQRTQTQFQETQTELQRTQAQFQETQAQFQETQAHIVAMEASKFWKLRKIWIRMKELIGLRKLSV
ncbi:MAG: glycosyltransferase [Nodosilinea sp. WJT8-NPBG4]|jgi:glycosyltransferase involved in cell wall biosynthesis/predicted SAM-dependent methyltransferase/Skp family chaperone for outer membrane proteins|nr:glycosyltransferase [Nodosilinea sp. WJT8-NPBG4]